MEEKYLVGYPVYKFRLTSDQSHKMNFEKCQSQCTLELLCSLANWVIFWQEIQEPTQPPGCVPNGLHERFSMNACETACGTSMKKFWNNQNRSEEAHDLGQCTLNLVLKNLSPSSLAGKALVLVPVSASYAGADPKKRLAGGGPGQMQQATSLSKQRHRNHTSEECSVCIVATVWAAGQNQT